MLNQNETDWALWPIEQSRAQLKSLCVGYDLNETRDCATDSAEWFGKAYVLLKPEHWEKSVDPNDRRRVVTAKGKRGNLVVEELIRLAIEQQRIDEKEAAEYEEDK